MLEKLFRLEKPNILQCQKIAKEIGFDKCEFDLVGPKDRLHCNWLDAYMGIFQIKGQDGFVMVRDFALLPDVYCENIMPLDPVTPPQPPESLEGEGESE